MTSRMRRVIPGGRPGFFASAPWRKAGGIAIVLVLARATLAAQEQPGALYRYDDALKPRWSTPEGLNGAVGAAAKENGGAKGHAFDSINAGATRVLLDVQGQGVVSRIWVTVVDRSPQMLRSLRLEMFWDNEAKPAVSAPLGDFFGVGLGMTAKFHNALFASPEGRSFICYIPMPFRKAARIQVTNDSAKDLTHIYFDVDYQQTNAWSDRNLYFHAFWNRDPATTLGRDFELLPRVSGRGRFLGVNVGVNANPAYKDTWWGEGEVKIFLNGDREHPTFAGTGSEDYIGTGWGEGEFFNDFSGCLVADEKRLQWAFYRFQIPDPVFFETGCRVTLQQIGGGPKATLAALQRANVPLIPVSVDNEGNLVQLYQKGVVARADDPKLPEGWMNFYRSDDVSATAYFYLGTPSDDLPPLQPAAVRVAALK
jgi:D-arabinan exo alpha-(1,3)/(1,5)-arabinofuranosidase (non-reducing end)